MLYGKLVNGQLTVDPDGLPIYESEEPKEVPAGYHAECSWRDTGSCIDQLWSVVPDVGTAADAAVQLARIQAASLTDDQALMVPALYPEWSANAVAYAKGDRVLCAGKLYKVVQAHTSQADWAPDAATSLFAGVLAGQDGASVGEWVQPDSTNPYAKGDRVTHGGKTWESLVDSNVWEPGATGSESLWKEVE